jgi:16S rRNA (guanine966-N2)-methyltransferase
MEKRFTSLFEPWHNDSVLRITSGTHRGRLIKTLPGFTTRPTTERLRQSWLNSLHLRLPESRILDLFSGSGALGLEALSRGADRVVFVEENGKAAKLIRENASMLGFEERCEIFVKRVEQILPLLEHEPPFDFIFADPPYDRGYEDRLLQEWPWKRLLAEGGRLCLESAWRKEGAYPPPAALEILRDERYGDSQLTFYGHREGTGEA